MEGLHWQCVNPAKFPDATIIRKALKNNSLQQVVFKINTLQNGSNGVEISFIFVEKSLCSFRAVNSCSRIGREEYCFQI